MTDDDLDQALAKIRAQQAADPDAALSALRAKPRLGLPKVPAAAADATRTAMTPTPNPAGTLQPKIASGNVGGGSPAAHALNIGQGIIPIGGRFLEAGMGEVGSHVIPGATPMTYRESLNQLDNMTGEIDPGLAMAEQFGGGVASLAGSAGKKIMGLAAPKVVGAVLGAGSQAADADPDEPMWKRALKTVAGGVIGYGGGKVLDEGMTGARVLASPNSEANILERQAARAQSAKQLYAAAKTEGEVNGATQAVRDFVAEPDIADRIARLQQLDAYRNTPAESPEMLDALYKNLSDDAKSIGKGLQAADPRKINTGQAALQDVTGKKQRLLGAMSTPGEAVPSITTAQYTPSLREALSDFDAAKGAAAQRSEGTPAQQLAREALERHSAERVVSPPLTGAPPTVETPAMMPSYADAVQDYAKRTGDINAVRRGATQLNERLGTSMPSAAKLGTPQSTTPTAFKQWLQPRAGETAQDLADRADAAMEGILGQTRFAFGKEKGMEALRRAGGVMRGAPSPSQALYDLIQRSTLAGANSLTKP